MWKLDAERCAKFMSLNQLGTGCNHCTKVCPWNKPEDWIHDTVRWMVKYTSFLDRFIIKLDDIWGYGKQNKKDKWWIDLEDIDGVLRVPQRSDRGK